MPMTLDTSGVADPQEQFLRTINTRIAGGGRLAAPRVALAVGRRLARRGVGARVGHSAAGARVQRHGVDVLAVDALEDVDLSASRPVRSYHPKAARFISKERRRGFHRHTQAKYHSLLACAADQERSDHCCMYSYSVF